jgi:hypothetical protein
MIAVAITNILPNMMDAIENPLPFNSPFDFLIIWYVIALKISLHKRKKINDRSSDNY